MNEAAYIQISGATLGYFSRGKHTGVLSIKQLDISRGELIGVVGLNGSGKSTLLKSLCGLIPVLSGKIVLDGEDMTRMDQSEVVKRVAVVLTEKIGGFNLNVFDTVASGQMPYTNAFHQLEEKHLAKINEAMAIAGVDVYAEKPLHELSDGMFQKTMIARALAQQTPAILLDEPTAFLDYASKHQLFMLLKKLSENDKKCVLVSTHDLDLVRKYCEKLLIVNNGSATLMTLPQALESDLFETIGGGYL